MTVPMLWRARPTALSRLWRLYVNRAPKMPKMAVEAPMVTEIGAASR